MKAGDWLGVLNSVTNQYRYHKIVKIQNGVAWLDFSYRHGGSIRRKYVQKRIIEIQFLLNAIPNPYGGVKPLMRKL